MRQNRVISGPTKLLMSFNFFWKKYVQIPIHMSQMCSSSFRKSPIAWNRSKTLRDVNILTITVNWMARHKTEKRPEKDMWTNVYQHWVMSQRHNSLMSYHFYVISCYHMLYIIYQSVKLDWSHSFVMKCWHFLSDVWVGKKCIKWKGVSKSNLNLRIKYYKVYLASVALEVNLRNTLHAWKH